MDFSSGYIFAQLMIGLGGASLFMYGKKAQRLWPLLGGIAMSIYPWFVTDVWLLWAIAIGICVVLYLLREK